MRPDAEAPSPETLLSDLRQGKLVAFGEVLDVIKAHYRFTPTQFDNGIGDDAVCNSADQNQGSCRVFAFARLHDLTEKETLACFAGHFREVLDDPDGTGHANIRRFMRDGWAGIRFHGEPLARRTPDAQ